MTLTQGSHDGPEAEARDRAPGRRLGRQATALGTAALTFFGGLYLYNTVRFDRDTLIGDQWYWVEHVLVPLDQGRMSLFEAITYEYATLSHSHVPALSAFVLNAELLGLNLTVDAVVGVVSLAGVLFLLHRWSSRFVVAGASWLVAGVVSSMLLMSSNDLKFAWSLLQFQMFYVLVAVTYLYTFARDLPRSQAVHAAVAVPAAVVLGDAIGVGAVVASLVYLALLAVLRRVPIRAAVPHAVSFAVWLPVLGFVLTGDRSHGNQPFGAFVQQVLDDPLEVIRALSYWVASAFVGLQNQARIGSFLLSWDAEWLWVALAIAVAGVVVVGMHRAGLERRDHLPLLLILTSAIWVAGVLRSRLSQGAEVMQNARYADYTTLAGIGLALLIAGKWRVLGPRLRTVAGGALVLIVVANGALSLAGSTDDHGERDQARELTTIRAYAQGRQDQQIVSGCRRTRPCLEAAWYLSDHSLGPFGDSERPDPPRWLPVYRAAVFESFAVAGKEQRAARCDMARNGTDAQVWQTVTRSGDGSISAYLDARDVQVPGTGKDVAMRVFRRATASDCAANNL